VASGLWLLRDIILGTKDASQNNDIKAIKQNKIDNRIIMINFHEVRVNLHRFEP
jgi:hypothetical protein